MGERGVPEPRGGRERVRSAEEQAEELPLDVASVWVRDESGAWVNVGGVQ